MERWVRVAYQLKRHSGKPLPGGRILRAAHRIKWSTRPAIALAVRLARDLHPQISVDQRHTRVSGWPVAQAATGRVAPLLRIACRVGSSYPWPLTVPARVDHEMHRR